MKEPKEFTCPIPCVLGNEGHCGRTHHEYYSHCEKRFHEERQQRSFIPILNPQKVVVLTCSKKKHQQPVRAKYLYNSDYFRSSYKYAQSLDPDEIFILSAKYHLVRPYQIIHPYDLSMNQMSASDRRKWAQIVLHKLEQVSNIRNTHFTFLGAYKYREHLIPHISNYSTPTAGMGIGKQLQWLKNNVSKLQWPTTVDTSGG